MPNEADLAGTPSALALECVRDQAQTPSIPYVCQWASPDLVRNFLNRTVPVRADPRWAASGAESLEQYEFWSRRACGLACLAMLLGPDTCPGVVALAVQAEAQGAFVVDGDTVQGLLYRPFARWVERDFGLELDIIEDDNVEALAQRVSSGQPFIASVHPSIREASPAHRPPARGGHLVLVHGSDETSLVLHNPSGDRPSTQHDVVISREHFQRYYAGRGMQVIRGPGSRRDVRARASPR
ncbi:MAG: hypothetical protein M3Y77_06160 [Actinomycetota bacterium]|nr:hypothetical protein [Actinomycetota bacterium]